METNNGQKHETKLTTSYSGKFKYTCSCGKSGTWQPSVTMAKQSLMKTGHSKS